MYHLRHLFVVFQAALLCNPYWPRTHSPVYVPKSWDYKCGIMCMVKIVENQTLALLLSYIPWPTGEHFNVLFSIVTYIHKNKF